MARAADGQVNHDSTTPPRLQLCPTSVQEAVTFMFKAFGEYPDEMRIAAYLELLEGCSTEEVWAAVKVWSRQAHERSAKAGELRDMILTARGRLAPVQVHEDEWERQRVTPAEKAEIIAGLTPQAKAFLKEACPFLFEAPGRRGDQR